MVDASGGVVELSLELLYFYGLRLVGGQSEAQDFVCEFALCSKRSRYQNPLTSKKIVSRSTVQVHDVFMLHHGFRRSNICDPPS